MEEDIPYLIAETLSATYNWKLKFDFHNASNYDSSIDGTLNLQIKNRTFTYSFIVKQRLSMASLHQFKDSFPFSTDSILLLDYIPKTVRNTLVDNEINFIDTAGNVFLANKMDLYIHIETGKSAKSSKAKSNRAFSKSGLKVVYQLLNNKEIVNETYRHIGRVSKVSIDTVGKVFKDLLQNHYLIRIDSNTYKLTNSEKLIAEWTVFFNKILRPKLKQRNFSLRNKSFQELVRILPHNTIGGDLAGEILSNHLIAESAICYIDGSSIEFAKKFGLIPNPNGEVQLMEKFWEGEVGNKTKAPIVSPLLVYADLMNNPTPRNLEVAETILRNYVYQL